MSKTIYTGVYLVTTLLILSGCTQTPTKETPPIMMQNEQHTNTSVTPQTDIQTTQISNENPISSPIGQLDCIDGKIYSNEETGDKACAREQVACVSADDCRLGDHNGYLCYNKNYDEWYNKNIPIVRWDYPVNGVYCACIKNMCNIEYPEGCSRYGCEDE